MTDEEALEASGMREEVLPQAIVVAGDFVRFDTSTEGNWRQFGVRFPQIIREFNFNSPMVVSAANPQLGIAFCRRDGATAGIWPMSMLTKVTAPVSLPAPPMVPGSLP